MKQLKRIGSICLALLLLLTGVLPSAARAAGDRVVINQVCGGSADYCFIELYNPAAAVQKISSAVPGSPKTGDSANWVFPASCLILSGALIVLLRKARKANRNAGRRVCRFR